MTFVSPVGSARVSGLRPGMLGALARLRLDPMLVGCAALGSTDGSGERGILVVRHESPGAEEGC